MSLCRLVVFCAGLSLVSAGSLSAQQPQYAQLFPIEKYDTRKDEKTATNNQKTDELKSKRIFSLDAGVTLVQSQIEQLRNYYMGFKLREMTLVQKIP